MRRVDGWRLRVAHETRFDYDTPARASYNELRLTPRTEPRQTVLESRVVTVPPAPQYSYIDYWGTQVVAFNVDRAHEVLTITGNSLVDTQRTDEPDDCTWEEVATRRDHADQLAHHLYTAPGPELAELAAGLRADAPRRPDGSSPRRTTPCATRGVSVRPHLGRRGLRGRRRCVPGLRAPRAGAGQGNRAPRSLRLGLLPPRRDALVGEEVTGESHAWLEVWTGRWWGYDPTNDCPVPERHVVVAHGRDYATSPRSAASTPETPRTPCGSAVRMAGSTERGRD